MMNHKISLLLGFFLAFILAEQDLLAQNEMRDKSSAADTLRSPDG